MSPSIYRERGYRFFFFSREESRMHVHVVGRDGEAKFWLEPDIALAKSHNLPVKELAKLEESVEAHKNEITAAWHKHFS